VSSSRQGRLLRGAWALLTLGLIGAIVSVRALWQGDNSDPNLIALFLVFAPYVAASMLLKITGKARVVIIALFLPVLFDVMFACAFTLGRVPGWDAEIFWRAARSLTTLLLLPTALGVALWLDRLDARESRES
jgi:hypothetical protein